FGAFTLSQAGMVVHWRREGGRRRWLPLAVNAVGAMTTAAALVVIIVAKFAQGAWITIVLIPALLVLFAAIKRHYRFVARQVASDCEIDVTPSEPPLVVVPIRRWNHMAEKAVRFGMSLCGEVIALHISNDEEETKALREQWARSVEAPLRRAGRAVPQLVCLASPYRRL